MAGIARILTGSGYPPGKAGRALIVALIFTFLGLAGGISDAAAQGIGQNQGATQQIQQQNPRQNRFPTQGPTEFPSPSQKRKKAMLDYNFKKLKEHVQDLAELAKSLQTDVEKSNENVLSLEIIKKAEEAEKLARKIKNEAKGF